MLRTLIGSFMVRVIELEVLRRGASAVLFKEGLLPPPGR